MRSSICSSRVSLVQWQKITLFVKNLCYAYFAVKLRDQENFLSGISMRVNTFAFSPENSLWNGHRGSVVHQIEGVLYTIL